MPTHTHLLKQRTGIKRLAISVLRLKMNFGDLKKRFTELQNSPPRPLRHHTHTHLGIFCAAFESFRSDINERYIILCYYIPLKPIEEPLESAKVLHNLLNFAPVVYRINYRKKTKRALG